MNHAGGELVSATGAAVGIGSAATAAAVAACCSGPAALGPLVVALLGAGGAVALEGLRPYTLPLLAVSAGAIGFSFWLGRRSAACSRRLRPSYLRIVSTSLVWVSALVWITAVVAVLWARFA